MKVPWKATPEQWQKIVSWKAEGSYSDSCILELRDRIAALEAAANSSAGLTGSNHPAEPDSSPAPGGGLVELVADVIVDSAAAYGTADEPARAAILMVADWLEQYNAAASGWADIIRQEVNDHG